MRSRSRSKVTDDTAASRYEIRADDELGGYARYRREDDRLVFFDTQIDPAHRGKGLGQELIRAALDDVRAQGKTVEPECEFVAAYINEHPEYLDLLIDSSSADLRPAA